MHHSSIRRLHTHWGHVTGRGASINNVKEGELDAFPVAATIPRVANYHWRNWAGTFEARPKFLYKPTTTKEIIAVLAVARNAGEKVKVLGGSNSPSDIAATDGHMISLENYRRVLHVDTKRGLMKVEAGITIQTIVEEAAQHRLALSNLASVTWQSISGAISTGTHGTGINSGILATYVREMDIINAKGEVLHCSTTQHPDLFHAACCGIGALGVISTVTIQLEPAYFLHAVETPMNFVSVLSSLNTLIHSADFFRFWWVPHTNKCWVWQANRTQKAEKLIPANHSIRRKLFHFVMVRKLYQFLLWLGTFVPKLVPFINLLYSRILFSTAQETIDRSDKQLTFDCLFKQYVSEWAIPVANTATALLRLKDIIKAHNLKVHFSVEVRFTKADDIWLSPSYGRDSAWIGIIMYRPYGRDPPGTTLYFKAFEEMMQELDGRPHWAKTYSMIGADFQRSLPHWEDFKNVRAKMDPDGLFTNPYLERLFSS